MLYSVNSTAGFWTSRLSCYFSRQNCFKLFQLEHISAFSCIVQSQDCLTSRIDFTLAFHKRGCWHPPPAHFLFINDKFLYQTKVSNSSFSCQLHLNDYKWVWLFTLSCVSTAFIMLPEKWHHKQNTTGTSHECKSAHNCWAPRYCVVSMAIKVSD